MVIPTTYPTPRQFWLWWETKIIDKAQSHMTVGELVKATTTWKQAHFGAVMLGSLQLSHSSSDKSEVTKGATSSSQQGETVEVWKFWLNDVKGSVHQHRKSPFPHLALSMYEPAPVSRDTACKYMPHRAGAWSPVASSSGTHSNLWGTTLVVPEGYQSVCTTWMPVPWKYLLNNHWADCVCQSSTSGGSPNQDCHRDKTPSTKGMGFGGFRPPRP